MRNPIAVLKSLTEKSKDETYKFQRLYRNLYNPEFYYQAFRNIYANKGSMTPGVDGMTLDCFGEKRIKRIIESLKDHSYQPKPARRKYIAKKSNPNKKRPLGIPAGDDKLVQEAVRMILESIYEPTFSSNSHGFRPGRGCHTALRQIQNTFKGAHWFVEGDIEACFDSFDHGVTIELLRRRIEDEQFIQLIWKFLKAGYMEQWVYHETYNGTPQGSGISPILANIYLNELDKFMENLKVSFDTGNSRNRKISHEYLAAQYQALKFRDEGEKIWHTLNKAEKAERTKTLKALQREQRKLTVKNPLDNSYKSIQYVRYADDFIVSVIGSKADAVDVKAAIRDFLENALRLKLSDRKTKITHTGKRARFLGYDITLSRDQTTKKRKDGRILRAYSYAVRLLVPREKWVGKLLEYRAIKITRTNTGRERFKAMHRTKLINNTDIDILYTYNSEIRGLYNFYSLANDVWKIGKFANIMKYSMCKTFACKYRTNVHRIQDKYEVNGQFTVAYETRSGRKESTFYNNGFERRTQPCKNDDIVLLPAYKRYDRPNSLRSRIKNGVCEMCGNKTNDIELHQVKRLKDLTGSLPWEAKMLHMHRKTLAVCPDCHNKIHPV